jgi:membrane fusion protein, multidrug efflux system
VTMTLDLTPETRRRIGRLLSIAIIAAAAITGLIVLRLTTVNPRTDDAEVFANFIGMAPLVNGPIVKLPIADNQLVKQGDLLYEIDRRPYAYALANAKSARETLEGQIVDESRTIASQKSGVNVAEANTRSSDAALSRASSAVNEAKADVANSEAALQRAQAESEYASNNLKRLEPLLSKQFVTVDQIDQARTTEVARRQAVQEARSQLALSQARLESANALYKQAVAVLEQSHEQVQQAAHAVTTLEPLIAQRSGRAAAIDTAQYDLDNCDVFAPFDGRVTNLTISEGAYAHAGQQVFTLIDTRVWWAVANFRETQLHHIHPGMKAYVYVLSRPNVRYDGVVDSIGFGVTPDADVVGKLTQGPLPDVQRTLNWVHLASRFPVRVRIEPRPNETFRLSESAVVVIRGETAPDRP